MPVNKCGLEKHGRLYNTAEDSTDWVICILFKLAYDGETNPIAIVLSRSILGAGPLKTGPSVKLVLAGPGYQT